MIDFKEMPISYLSRKSNENSNICKIILKFENCNLQKGTKNIQISGFSRDKSALLASFFPSRHSIFSLYHSLVICMSGKNEKYAIIFDAYVLSGLADECLFLSFVS
jgi:hypothetical protein